MKNQKNTGSKRFWMVLAALLGIFILISSMLLFIPSNTTVVDDSGNRQPLPDYSMQSSEDADHSFEAVKDRVDSANDNYGSQIKSAYAGENSTMERVMKQRMVFTAIKNILLYAIMILLIVLILVKGFNLALFRKKNVSTDPAEPDKEKPVQASSPNEEKSGKAAGIKESAPVPIKNESAKQEGNQSSDENEEAPKKPDEQAVVSGCQLP